MQGFATHPGRWVTVRLQMTVWNVGVRVLIVGALGGVVRYRVQADRFAAVDRTLAERAHDEPDERTLRSNPGKVLYYP